VRSHEFIFLLVKKPGYYFNHSAALEFATGYDGRRIWPIRLPIMIRPYLALRKRKENDEAGGDMFLKTVIKI